jgi:hypothetical protein
VAEKQEPLVQQTPNQDLSMITDVNTLKAMAYDQLLARAQIEQNIGLLEARIRELA